MADSKKPPAEKTTKVRLIFFEEPRELTDAQIEEARQLGHLAEGKKDERKVPAGGVGAGPDPQSAALDPAGDLVEPGATAKTGKESK